MLIEIANIIYINNLNIFENKISFALVFFNNIIFSIKCIIYILMYSLTSIELATNMTFGQFYLFINEI